MDLLEQIMARAKSNPQRIVLPEGTEPRTLEAANIILKEKAAQLILIGNAEEINKMAAEKGYTYISEATIVDPSNDPRMPKYANLLYELRKSKGMTMEEAEKFTIDIAYGSEKRRDAEKKKEYALQELVVGDFIDIACRECVSAEVDKRLKQHLKELKNQEKVKAALEKRKAAKAKNIAENKETWRKEQKKAADKKAARARLTQKGLIAEDSARNGKLSHWGDSRS